jgi:hypothetical protein
MEQQRRMLLQLDEEAIRAMLQLPIDVHIVGIRDNFRRNAIEVLLISDRFDVVAAGCEAPLAHVRYEYNPLSRRLEVEMPDL